MNPWPTRDAAQEAQREAAAEVASCKLQTRLRLDLNQQTESGVR